MLETKNTKAIGSRKPPANDVTPSYAVTHVPFARENAKNATKWEGRRYLGRSKNNADIWINFKIERDSTKASAKKTVKIWSSASLDNLREEGAKFADCRVSFGTGKDMHRDLNAYLNDRNNVHGKVTERTLDWIDKVVTKIDENNPSRSDFYQVANVIYTGTYEDCMTYRKRFTLTQLLQEWWTKE